MQNGGVQSAVKNVLRGVLTMGAVNTASVTIPAVDMSKAELRMLGSSTTETATRPDYVWCRLQLVDSTTITATRQGNGGGTVFVSWELTICN